MRTVRLLAALLTLLTTGLLLAPGASAQQPFRLLNYVTDQAGALGSNRAAVTSAVDKLYNQRQVRLWVVYVDTFSGQPPVSWAQSTRQASDLGGFDALLAVATADRSYAFLVPSTVQSVTASQVNDVRRNQIEPALHRGDWAGAAIAAANGLNRTQSPQWVPLLLALGVISAGLLTLLLVRYHRRQRRRAAEAAAAQRIDPTDPDALADVPLDALDKLSRSIVVRVDNAVRTSTNELAVAVEEFGRQRTEPFTRAVNNAKAALAQAFTVRQQLDDAIPETPAQRRELLTRVVVSAAQANRQLESQTEAFEELRDLVINAPSLLDRLTQQVVELTARVAPAEQRLAALYDEFTATALASVAGNVTSAKERVAFAEQNVSRARDLADRPVSGEQAGLVDSYRAAESALGQARSLLDAVDSAATDIRHAVATLPSLIGDVESGIGQAGTHLAKAPSATAPHARELAAAADTAAKAVATARATGSADPLGAFVQLTKADAELDRLLATVAEEQATAERLARTLDQAIFTAESRVRAVSDYIDTRRGSIGPEARTRLAEASRQLEAAQAKRATNLSEAIAHANGAAALAAQAQSLANADVRSTQLEYAGRYGGGNDMGAMMGGIIIGNVLGGGFGGGWGPTSFGGSGDGGFFGGGGRF